VKNNRKRIGAATRLAIVGYPWLKVDHELLLKAARRRNWSATLWQPDRLELVTDDRGSRSEIKGRVAGSDLVIPRGVNRVFPFVAQWLHVLAQTGCTVVNGIGESINCLDKLRTTLLLSEAGIPVLPTTVSLLAGFSPKVDLPVVVKPAFGSGGSGVRFFSDPESFSRAHKEPPLRDASVAIYEHKLVQPRASCAGLDYRVVAANGMAIAATTRQASKGSAVTNGRNSKVSPGAPEAVRSLAESAVKALNIRFGGVDIIEHQGSFFVLEVNCWPGLALTSEVCGVNLADILLDVADHVRREKPSDHDVGI